MSFIERIYILKTTLKKAQTVANLQSHKYLAEFFTIFFFCLFVLWCKKLGGKKKKALLCEPAGRKIIKVISQGFSNYLYTAKQIDTLSLFPLPNLSK